MIGTMFVSKGPVYNSAEGRFDIAEGSFIDGMQKRDIPIYGNGVNNLIALLYRNI